MKRPTTKRGWLGLGCGGIIVLVLACAALGAVTGSRPRSAAAPTQAAALAAAVPTDAPAPEATDGPTNTPAPTDTPVPTEEPTATPEPTAVPPTATPIPPQEFSGSGQVVEELQIDVVSTIAFTHNGRSNFSVIAYGSGDDRELLVNEIGAYQGVRWLPPGAYTIEIDADGAWTMVVAPIGADDAAAGALQGTGDYVSGIFIAERGRDAYTFTHDGTSNFAVLLMCETGRDLLMNEIGPVQAEAVVSFPGERCFWDVSANGSWTIAPK
jgi:hypothetical protein